MNYGMPGTPQQQQQQGPPGYPGAPGPQQQQQQQQGQPMNLHVIQQKLQQQHQFQLVQLQQSVQSGQISQSQFHQMAQNLQMKYQQAFHQQQANFHQRYPNEAVWRQQQMAAAAAAKEPQTPAERKKMAQLMEMQKQRMAAQNHMIMGRPGATGPPMAYPQGTQPPPGMMPARMQMMYPQGPSSSGGPGSVQGGQGPPSVQSAINASPQLAHSLQPSTPRYPEHGPPSIPAPGSIPQPGSVPQDDPQNVEYMKVLREMKAEFLDRVKAIYDRCTMEKVDKPKGISQLLEILEEKRKVPIATLHKVRPSLVILVTRDCLTFPLMDELRRQLFEDKDERDKALAKTQKTMETIVVQPTTSAQAAIANASAGTSNYDKSADDDDDPEDLRLSDNWKNFRHMRIRVPQFVKDMLNEHYEKVERKRKNDGDKEEIEKKKLKKEEDLEEVVKLEENVEKMEAEVEEVEEEEEEEEEEDLDSFDTKYQIPCLFDNRKPWIMPKKARIELENVKGWSIDELCLPACSTTPFVVVAFKSQVLMCISLRIAIPRGYPKDPASVQYDRSFAQNTFIGIQLQKLFDKWLGIRPIARNIADYCDAFENAVQEFKLYRQTTSVLNGAISAPIAAPEYDAVVVTANKTTSKIAHKGMVA